MKKILITITSILCLATVFILNAPLAQAQENKTWVYDSQYDSYYYNFENITLGDKTVEIHPDSTIFYRDQYSWETKNIDTVTDSFELAVYYSAPYYTIRVNNIPIYQTESLNAIKGYKLLFTDIEPLDNSTIPEPQPYEKWTLADDGFEYYNLPLEFNDFNSQLIKQSNDMIIQYSDIYGNWHTDFNNLEFDMVEVLLTHSINGNFNISLDFYFNNDFVGDRLVVASFNHQSDIWTWKGLRRIASFEIPGDNIGDLSQLPSTDINSVGTVKFDINGYNLKLQVRYDQQVYYLTRSFTSDTDMSIFNTIESYYMNVNNNPQIIINHSDRPYLREILEAPENEKPAFVPHTVWDLKSNQLKTQSDYRTNVYIKQADDGPIIAYVYIDEYIIDNLLTANLSWTQRQKNGFPANIISGKYTDWETVNEVLVSDDYLEYRNLTSDWQNYVPLWNIVRGIYQLSKTYEMPRIEAVNFNNTQKYYNVTKTEVESHFRQTNDKFEQFNSNPRYKLWALALQGGKSYQGTQTEIYHNPYKKDDPKNLKIIHLTYETNGKLYEAVGNDMDLIINLHPDIDGIANEKDTNIVRAIVIAVVVIGWFYTLAKNKGFKNLESFIKITVLYLVVALVGLFIFNNFIMPDILGTVILRL